MKGSWRLKAFTLVAPAAAVALVIAACGGGQATATPVPTAPPQPTATRPPQVSPTATTAPNLPSPTAPSAQPTATAQATQAPRPTATPQATATAAPPLAPNFANAKYGGTLIGRVESNPPSFDTVKELTGHTHDTTQQAYDQLIMHDPNDLSKIVGQAAESWTVSSDNLVWTFKLRRGITFVNGDPLTAQDVKYTYDLILRPPSDTYKSPWAANIASVKSVTTPDDYTVVLTLGAPDASILAGLAAGPLVIVNKKFIEAQGRERLGKWPPVGSGPYMGKEGSYIRGVSAELFKRPDYWVPGRPYLDGIKIFIVPDLGTAFSSFLTGQINFGLDVKPGQAQEARQRLGDKVILQQTANDTWWSLALNIRRAPFDDIRVREAVAYGLDKQGYIKTVNQGLGFIAGFVPPGSGYELPPDQLAKIAGYGADRKANIAAAKKLLADAGYPNGLKITYLVRNLQVYIDSAIFMKASMEEIGVTGDLNIVDTSLYYDATNKNLPAWVVGPRAHRTPIADPNGAYQSFHLCGGGNNATGICDPKLEQMYKAQNEAAGDPAKRRQLVWDLENYTLRTFNEPVTSYNESIYAKWATVKNHTFPVFYKTNRQFRDVWIEK